MGVIRLVFKFLELVGLWDAAGQVYAFCTGGAVLAGIAWVSEFSWQTIFIGGIVGGFIGLLFLNLPLTHWGQQIKYGREIKALIDELEDQRSVGRKDLDLSYVSTLCNGNDGKVNGMPNAMEHNRWLKKLQKLKTDMKSGKLPGQIVLNAQGEITMESHCKITDLIDYFKSGSDELSIFKVP